MTGTMKVLRQLGMDAGATDIAGMQAASPMITIQLPAPTEAEAEAEATSMKKKILRRIIW